ncbi:hypothetical protein LNQ81_02105 [Myroides sp. M-43]|uniref:hypothetical protein n=1 Tax=Myroides oncorhynchi TaxID=2893756 RepID=UPI001E459FF7|nr:hypothetical protein [Myroides oncorhynchi]MCC9041509.1 hypothetical protein [Myroides oncorhynchi]
MTKVYKVFFASILFLVVSCGKTYTNEDLKVMNGYWEIEKAKMPEGEVKDYTINASIDYFEINEKGEGIRQKVMPQVNGEYLTNEVAEKLTIINENGITWLKYKTDFAEWKEELIKLDEDEFVVKNENDIMYYYKKAVPFTLK